MLWELSDVVTQKSWKGSQRKRVCGVCGGWIGNWEGEGVHLSNKNSLSTDMEGNVYRLFSDAYTLFFYIFYFSRQGYSVLLWNLLCRPFWPRTQKSTCLCLLSAGIKGERYHAWP